MTDATTGPACLPRDPTGWRIAYQDDPPSWVAVHRPTPTCQHVLVAHDLPSLRDKIASAHARTPGHTAPGT